MIVTKSDNKRRNWKDNEDNKEKRVTIREEIGSNHWELFPETCVLEKLAKSLKMPKAEFIFSKIKFLFVKFRRSY